MKGGGSSAVKREREIHTIQCVLSEITCSYYEYIGLCWNNVCTLQVKQGNVAHF